MSKFKFDPNSTKNEGRYRLKDPKDFIRFYRRKSKTPGISFILGWNKRRGEYMVQAIRFNRKHFTESKAAKWWKIHSKRIAYLKFIRYDGIFHLLKFKLPFE